MAFNFIHTSDWQVGKVFRYVDDTTLHLLQEARLSAITRIGEIANEHDVKHVLVAGDVYDAEAPDRRTLAEPLTRMRRFESVTWHLLPGNHDHHRPNGLWYSRPLSERPSNVNLLLESKPVSIEENVYLLPVPLNYRATIGDSSEYMDDVDLPEHAVRIGVAHGSIVGFGSDDREAKNYISPDRPQLAGLAYLAMGDWHGTRKINDRCWYSGTHETDSFNVVGGGQVLLVEVDDDHSVPTVKPIQTGSFNWYTCKEQINNIEEIDSLEEQLRQINGDHPEQALVHLHVEGTLTLKDELYFQERIIEGVADALRFLRVDDKNLFSDPTEEDLERIDHAGVVRVAADTLMAKAKNGKDDERELATEALRRLYLEHKKLQEG